MKRVKEGILPRLGKDLFVERKTSSFEKNQAYISTKARNKKGKQSNRRLISLGELSDEQFKFWQRLLGQSYREKFNDSSHCIVNLAGQVCPCARCKKSNFGY